MKAAARDLVGSVLVLTGVGAVLYAALDARTGAFAALLVVSSVCLAAGRRLLIRGAR